MDATAGLCRGAAEAGASASPVMVLVSVAVAAAIAGIASADFRGLLIVVVEKEEKDAGMLSEMIGERCSRKLSLPKWMAPRRRARVGAPARALCRALLPKPPRATTAALLPLTNNAPRSFSTRSTPLYVDPISTQSPRDDAERKKQRDDTDCFFLPRENERASARARQQKSHAHVAKRPLEDSGGRMCAGGARRCRRDG